MFGRKSFLGLKIRVLSGWRLSKKFKSNGHLLAALQVYDVFVYAFKLMFIFVSVLFDLFEFS